jgi:hypothetical protein
MVPSRCSFLAGKRRNKTAREKLGLDIGSEETMPKRKRKWSRNVTEHSNALDLKKDVFRASDAKDIAHSLKISAERSHRRKSSPFRSAMSMLTFYINRAGRNLSTRRKHVLEDAKDELRAQFDKDRR